MAKKLRRAFTIVELVIVIAVIAILAAVLIPTFTSLIQKANVSNDTSLCRNLNTELAMDESENGKPESMKEVLAVLEKAGYKIDTLSPTANGYYYVWDKISNQILLVDENFTVEYSSKTYDVDNKEFWLAVGKEDTVSFALGEENIDGILFTSDYSGELDVTRSLAVDTLDGAVINIVNINLSEALTAEVGGEVLTLNINAPSGEVTHTGSVKNVTITAVAPDSYVEKGSVTEVLNITTGHLKIEDGAKIERVVFPAAANNVRMTNAGTVALTEVEEGAQSVTIENSGSMGVFNNQTGETITITGNQPDANLDVSNLKTLPEVLGLAASGTAAEPAPATSYTISENVYIQLSEDFYFGEKAASNDNVLTIAEGYSVVLDLNGYSLILQKHGYNDNNAYGRFIRNNGNLSIIDTSAEADGTIEVLDKIGDYAVAISNNGNMYLNGGSLILRNGGRALMNTSNGIAYCEVNKFNISVYRKAAPGSGTNEGAAIENNNGIMIIGREQGNNSDVNIYSQYSYPVFVRNEGTTKIHSGIFKSEEKNVSIFMEGSAVVEVDGGLFCNDVSEYFADLGNEQSCLGTSTEEGMFLVTQVPFTKVTVNNFTDFKFYLTAHEDKVYFITIGQNFEINEDIQIPYGTKVSVPQNITLTVGNNSVLTVKGYLLAEGILNVAESGFIGNIDKVTTFDGSAYAGFALTKDSTGIYNISAPFDLARFSYSVNNLGNTFIGEKVRLANNIDMNGKDFTPIGNFYYGFQGEFDGNSKIISNLSVYNVQLAGLFGLTDNAYIHDLTLENVDVQGENYVGVIVARAYNGVILKNITTTGRASGSSYYGPGLVGSVTKTSSPRPVYFINCNSSVEITGSFNVGAMFGTATGYTNDIYVSNCTNNGNISASGSFGQICGYGNGTGGHIYYDAFTVGEGVTPSNLIGANGANAAEKTITISGDFSWNAAEGEWNVSAEVTDKVAA